MSTRELYEALIASRKIERDRAQETLLARRVGIEQRGATARAGRRSNPGGWRFGPGDQGATARGL